MAPVDEQGIVSMSTLTVDSPRSPGNGVSGAPGVVSGGYRNRHERVSGYFAEYFAECSDFRRVRRTLLGRMHGMRHVAY